MVRISFSRAHKYPFVDALPENLQLCGPTENASPLASQAPSMPRTNSLLSRLARLALETFGCNDAVPSFHPDPEYAAIVRQSVSLVLPEASQVVENDVSIQALFELLEDPMWNWGMLPNEQTEQHMES